MKKLLLLVLFVSPMLTFSGCVSMSNEERAKLTEVKACGYSENEIKKKDPTTAALLNILPGIGNFYLAWGTNEGGEWGYGVFNLLLWPISPIWAIAEGACDADIMNKKETAYYYSYDPKGKQKMQDCQSAKKPAETTPAK